MTTQTGDAHNPSWLALWWWRRLAHRRQIELAVIDMHDRYGAAAYLIARNSARAGGGAEHRRFWSKVARKLRRSRFAGARDVGSERLARGTSV